MSFVEASTALRENIAGLIAVLATIPLGFIVYQAYYFTYGPTLRLWPRRWRGRFVRTDRGWKILTSLEKSQIAALEGIFNVDIDLREPYKVVDNPEHWYRNPGQKILYWFRLLELTDDLKKIPMRNDDAPASSRGARPREEEYTRRWYSNWDVLRSILDIAGSIPGSSQIKSEYTILSDLYHSLGAARTAVLSGWALVSMLALTHFGRIEDNLSGSLLGFATMSVVTALLYYVLHSARRRTWKSASSSLRLGLRWLFWRHADEFAPSERRLGKKGTNAMLRGAGEPAVEDIIEEAESPGFWEGLRPAMRGMRERITDAVTGGDGGGEEPGDPPLPQDEDSSPTPMEGKRRLVRSTLIAFGILAGGLAALWLTVIPTTVRVAGTLAISLAFVYLSARPLRKRASPDH